MPARIRKPVTLPDKLDDAHKLIARLKADRDRYKRMLRPITTEAHEATLRVQEKDEHIASLQETLSGYRTAHAKRAQEISAAKIDLAVARTDLAKVAAERDEALQSLDAANVRLMEVEAALVNLAVRLS